MPVLRPLTVSGLVVLLVCGCASPPRDAGFSEVGGLVAERTEEPLHWRGVSIEEESTR